jgi:hypothetical protein
MYDHLYTCELILLNETNCVVFYITQAKKMDYNDTGDRLIISVIDN